jgi:D-alanyl-D-alanine carboxypeptidase (penicillin-binding protein 5/6)
MKPRRRSGGYSAARPARLGLGVVLALAALASGAAAQSPTDRYPKAARSYLVAIDGQVVWERAADAPLAPASLTKIMTALVLLDHNFTADSVVTISRRAAAISGAQIGLRAGQKMTAGDLFTAMLVRSANDACTALAEHDGKTVEAFVARMNERAAAMHLSATHFVNPCGLDAPGHRSSARDLFQLTQVALTRPLFASTVSMERAQVRVLGGPAIALTSSNGLLGRLAGARGVKTGYTNAAGTCLIAAAERNGTRVIAVLLNATDRWWASAALIEKAFEQAAADR